MKESLRIGIVVVTMNDLHLSKEMAPTLIPSMGDTAYNLVCVDGGSTDGSVEFWQKYCQVIGKHDIPALKDLGYEPHQLQSFAACLNLGMKSMYNEVSCFVQLHPDMTFPYQGWADVLADYLENHPDVGRVAADEYNKQPIKPGDRNERAGNNPCIMLSKVAAQALIDNDGYIYDEAYMQAGGWEDWDIHRRLMKLGFKIMITPDAVIQHPGMMTRKRPGSHIAQGKNALHYFKKFGDYKCPV